MFLDKEEKKYFLGFYSKTSKTRAEILAFPPVGKVISVLQTRQCTALQALLNTTCSFLHLEHLTFMNLLLVSNFILY